MKPFPQTVEATSSISTVTLVTGQKIFPVRKQTATSIYLPIAYPGEGDWVPRAHPRQNWAHDWDTSPS